MFAGVWLLREVLVITVRLVSGTKDIEPKEVRGHFAIHRPIVYWGPAKCWAVTHVPSGLFVCMVRSLIDARLIIRQLRKLDGAIGWNATSPSDALLRGAGRIVQAYDQEDRAC